MSDDRDAPDDGDSSEDRDSSDDAWRGDRFPSWDSDDGALRAARDEARESLEETLDSIRRIDEAAMTTLRIDLVILGLSVTAASSFSSASAFVNGATILGFAAVTLSTVVAVGTTIGSEYPTGVSEEYLQEFQQVSWSEREWNAWMVREYSRWLSDANEMVNGDARALLYTRLLLGSGILLLIAGIVTSVV